MTDCAKLDFVQLLSADLLSLFQRQPTHIFDRPTHPLTGSTRFLPVICLSREVTIRAKVIKRMIKIAKYLLDYNNFNGLMAVILGLNAAPVSRLKLTWEEVASKHMATMADLEQV